jgi:GntR family transcriptional regulator/MocR family aminotransferase
MLPSAGNSALALDRLAPASLQDQIVEYYRAAVLDGRLRPGTRVASSRQVAAEQGVARITVVQAHDRLVAEGYLVARPGAGLFVAPGLSAPERPVPGPGRTRPAASPPRATLGIVPRPFARHDLTPGLPALDHFPWAEWSRLTARVLRGRPAAALGYADPRGHGPLRQAIAAHLGGMRGILCSPEQIVVVAGSQQGIDLAARAVAMPGEACWYEEPGYPIGRAALDAAGIAVIPVPVDADGLDPAAGRRLAPAARLALVAPAHQYPLGATMTLARRLALLDWAEQAGAWIIEDDYDGEFRHGGRPLATLHALDGGRRVFHLGTFSKSLAPGLRLGYLVVPEPMIEVIAALKAAADRGAPGIEQMVLAEFITEGRFAAHLRRMRLLYAQRRACLREALSAEAAGLLDASGAAEAGLHLVAQLAAPGDDVAIARAAADSEVGAAPLSTYYRQREIARAGFVIGFAGTTEARMMPAVRRLAHAITSARRLR